MTMDNIITNLTDTDWYKFTMGNIAFQRFQNLNVEYKFKCRNQGIVWTFNHIHYIENQIMKYCMLKYTEEELKYLSKYFPQTYITFLKNWQGNFNHFNIKLLENGELDIRISGPWCWVIYYEVPVLAIIGEVYHRLRSEDKQKEIETEAYKRLDEKNKNLKSDIYNFKFADMGTRRRFSKEFQYSMFAVMNNIKNFIGTSNVFWSMCMGKDAIGTMAHEYLQIGQALPSIPLYLSQKEMLEIWNYYYQYSNSKFMTALTDVIGIDYFLQDFNMELALSYRGLRQDSGDPFEWGNKVLNHYKKLGIDPKTKTLIFSDNLNFNKAQELWNEFHDKTNVLFGIGTYLTNDSSEKALQNVIKLVSVNGKPVAKISDSPGKIMCEDDEYVKYLMWSFKNRR